MAILLRSGPVIAENNFFLSRANKFLKRQYTSDIDEKNDKFIRSRITKNEIKEEDEETSSEASIENLKEPTNCCMSGCANCVWIRYAEKLSRRITNSNDDVKKIIMERIQDPNMRAFLSMELKCRNIE